MTNYENYNECSYEDTEEQGLYYALKIAFRIGVAIFIVALPIAQVLFFGWIISIL